MGWRGPRASNGRNGADESDDFALLAAVPVASAAHWLARRLGVCPASSAGNEPHPLSACHEITVAFAGQWLDARENASAGEIAAPRLEYFIS
jgi:hypothetical protein